MSWYRKWLYAVEFICMAGAVHPTTTEEKPIAVILLGPPGSGKGTHAPMLGDYLHVPHISTGDLFRENIRNETPIGMKAKEFIDFGKLVPDEIVLDMLFARMKYEDCKSGVILDGFPRTLPQAIALDQKIQKSHRRIVLLLSVTESVLTERIVGRLACKGCGRPYHKTYNPPKVKNRCDFCEGELFQRVDDTEEVLQKRLAVYRAQTEPLVAYYKKQEGVLFEINAGGTMDAAIDAMLKVLPKQTTLVH